MYIRYVRRFENRAVEITYDNQKKQLDKDEARGYSYDKIRLLVIPEGIIVTDTIPVRILDEGFEGHYEVERIRD